MTGLPLQPLYYFYHAADLGSFKAAADALFVTPGAMSQQIRALEERLNVQLFQRQHRKIELTYAGKKLFPYAQQAFESLQEGLKLIGDDPDPLKLTISTLPSFAREWLIPRLGGLKKRAPDLAIAMMPTHRMVDFNRDPVDLCVRFGPGNYPGLHSELLMPDYLYPVCHPIYLEQNPINSLEDLCRCSLLEDTRPDISWKDWLVGVGVETEPNRVSLQYDGTSYVIEGALSVQGVALVRHSVVSRYVAEGTLIKLFDQELTSSFQYWLVAPPSHFNREKVKTVTHWLKEEAQLFNQCIDFNALPAE